MQAEADNDTRKGLPFDPNSVFGTLVIAIVLCLICSLLVSFAAVGLKEIQDRNRVNKMRRNVLAAAGIWNPSKHSDRDIDSLFKPIEIVLVNLPGREGVAAGSVNTQLDPVTYSQDSAMRDPQQSTVIPLEQDLAGIKRRELVSKVYLVRDAEGRLQTLVLPIYGKGLWSTLFGFLALEADGKTVKGITFYKHGETPGLGGEVDNPKWKAQWPGKIALNDDGTPVLNVTKPGYAKSESEVDGLSGATITSNGVRNTVQYWLGENGYGPFLARVRRGEFQTSGGADSAGTVGLVESDR